MIYPRVPGLVSVVITGYNHARYASECLESIRQQTYSNLEIVIVDDASTDDLDLAVELWQNNVSTMTQSPEIIFVRLPRQIGYAGALTTGFFLAQGEYIAVQNLDDFCAHTRIEVQVKYLQEHTDIDLVGTNVEEFKDNHTDVRTECDWIEYGDAIHESIVLGRPAICMASILFRGVIFDYFGGLPREPLGMEDHQFFSKCVANQTGIDNLREVLYYARNHSGQRTRRLARLLGNLST